MNSIVASTIVLLATTATCRATIEFAAYTQAAQEAKFVLTDTADSHPSGWLEIGESFKGYALVAFDRQAEVLSVRKDQVTIALPLKTARVKDGNAKAKVIARDLADAKADLTTLLMRYKDKHPKVIVERNHIADLERQLAKLTEQPYQGPAPVPVTPPADGPKTE